MAQKEVKKQLASKNFYLYVFDQIKEGLRPSHMCKNLGISKQRLNYYLSSLKRDGFIKKISYGTWEIIEKRSKKEVKKQLTGSPHQHVRNFYFFLKPDMVRGHAFLFTIQIPKLRNWPKREQVMEKRGIKFKRLENVFGEAQKIEFKGRKIHLTSKSIIIYEKSSYMAETSSEAKSYAINELLKLIRSLERFLGADFSFQGQYRFKVSKQHYALVKNALARQYDQEGKKLQVYNAGELWFVIDNSFNLHEAETLHPRTADIDNKKIQDFFNDLKINPITLSEARKEYYYGFSQIAKQIKAHLLVVNQIKKQTPKVTQLLNETKELIHVLKEKEK